MQIQSMTGYGRAEGQTGAIKATCELRALNGRYFEVDIRLPKFLYEIDPDLRRLLAEKLERGTITCIFNIEFGSDPNLASAITVNESLARVYLGKLNQLSSDLGLEFRDPFREIIRIPDVISGAERVISDETRAFIKDLALRAAKHLVEFRVQEGLNTGKKLKEAADAIRIQLDVVESEEENRRAGLRERIYGHLAEHVKENVVDASRFEQEFLLYLEKWDIAEEKSRLKQHLDYFETCLQTEPLGRKLNFIAQEMGREMNTMGVKSNYYPMQQAVVLMKERLEQIKEQVLNLV
jgi:uncharacterized protein (TIGR00255 family)